MKTIEEKAIEYANENTGLGLSKEMAIRAYLAGATEALAGQWRKEDDKLPENQRDVFVRYVNYAGGVEYGCAYYDGEDWYTTDGTHIRPTHWMSIPEPHKDESHV